MGLRRRTEPIVPRVPLRTSWSRRVAFTTTATGMDAGRPPRRSRRASSATRSEPMRTTTVPPTFAIRSQEIVVFPGASWPVAIVTMDA